MKRMTLHYMIRAFAGTFVLISLALGMPQSPWHWNDNALWFTAFVGFNLLQSSITRFCPLETFLKKLGVPE